MREVRVIECEVYSRVVGYYRPVSGWNDGKKAEFEARKMISVSTDRPPLLGGDLRFEKEGGHDEQGKR